MKKIRFRYSLRLFVLALVVFAIAMGFWNRGALEQQRQVRLLNGVHFNVTYEVDLREDDSWLLPLRSRLAKVLGRDWVSVPVEAEANAESVYPEDLAMLAKLRWLRRVDLRETTTDDEMLTQIGQLPSLESLILSGTLVTRLDALAQCRSLQYLELHSTLVEDAEIQQLKKRLPACQVISSWPVSPSTVEDRRFRNLRSDRALTDDEKLKRDVWLAVLQTTDAWEQFLLIRKIEPGEDLPPVGSQEYQDMQERMKAYPASATWDDAIAAIGHLGLADDIPVLERIARDPSLDSSLRQSAAVSLSYIADPRIVPILIDLLEDEDQHVAFEAWNRLTKVTGETLGHVSGVDCDPNSPSRRQMVEDWRKFWKENGDVIRPRRTAGSPME